MELDCEEFHRWFDQALYTYNLIDSDINNKGNSWACFKAQQCGELTVKSILLSLGKNAFGHGMLNLYNQVIEIFGPNREIKNAISYLDKLYISPRCPDAFTECSPWEHFTDNDALLAKEPAAKIISYVKEVVSNCQ